MMTHVISTSRAFVVGAIFLMGVATVLSCATSASAQTVVVWDGTNSPADEGYTGGGSIFDINNPPGFMNQNGNSAKSWNISPALNGIDGWFVEIGFELISNTGADRGFAAAVLIQTAQGNVNIAFGDEGNKLAIMPFQGGKTFSQNLVDGQTHVVRVECGVPGVSGCDDDNTPDYFLDGSPLTGIPALGSANIGNLVTFGQHSGSGNNANINWDYIAINEEIPEPSSVMLLTLGVAGLLAFTRRRRQ